MTDVEPAIREHRAAVGSFLRAAEVVPEPRWAEPIAAGKWTPGQNTEHVALSAEQALGVLDGTSELSMIPRPLRPLMRWIFLGGVLKAARFPRRAKAPPPLSPARATPPKAAALARFAAVAANFEQRAAGLSASTVVHPVFGRLPVAEYILVNARHVTHHEAQLTPHA